jgi:hypothetical protein
LLTRGPGPEARHPISSGLEQAALALKKLAVEPTPISVRAVEDIRHDAARVLAELLEVLYHLERVTGESTGVIPALATALEALEPSN